MWKVIVHLRTRDDLRVAVLDCDFGVGLVCKGEPDSRLDYSPEQIAALSYEDLASDRERLLNLKPAGFASTFVKYAHRGLSGAS